MNARTRTQIAAQDALTGTTLVDPLNADIGAQDKSVALSADQTLAELRDSLNSTVSLDVNDPHFKRFTADSAFMEEQVLVRVHPSSEQNAEAIVDVYNNGTPQRFPRGHWVIARRKFVEVLARAKPFSITTPEYNDGNGDRATRIDKHAGLRYPFEMRDTNPMGTAWLNSVMAEA